MRTESPVSWDASTSVATFAPFDRLISLAGGEAEARVAVELERMLAAHGITPEAIAHDFARVPYVLTNELIEMTARVLNDPCAGLHAAATWQFGDQELFDYLCGSAATLRECVECAIDYLPLLTNARRMSLHVAGDVTELRSEPEMGLLAYAGISDFSVGLLVRAASHFLGFDAPPQIVRFARAAPANAAAYAEFFRTHVEWSAAHDALVISTAALDLKLATADPALHRLLLRYARQILHTIPARRPFAETLRVTIEELLPDGAAIRAVAKRHAMSEPTLRRKLDAEGTTYTDIVEQVRKDLSLRLLAETSLTLDEISERLGFAQTPTFYRAFKRWFGHTPAAYRRVRYHPFARLLRRP